VTGHLIVGNDPADCHWHCHYKRYAGQRAVTGQDGDSSKELNSAILEPPWTTNPGLFIHWSWVRIPAGVRVWTAERSNWSFGRRPTRPQLRTPGWSLAPQRLRACGLGKLGSAGDLSDQRVGQPTATLPWP
jgi:hypothetical protein